MKDLYMSSVLLISAVLLIFLFCSTGEAIESANNEQKVLQWTPPPPINCTKNQGGESEGFTLKADMLKNPVPQGEKVILRLTLTNVSETQKTVIIGGPTDFAFLIQDPCGNQHKIDNQEQFEPLPNPFLNILNLEHGETYIVPCDVGEVYDFPLEGDYQITAGRRIPTLDGKGTADVISNTVVLTIAPPSIDFTRGQGEESEGFTLKAELDQNTVHPSVHPRVKGARLSLTLTNVGTTERTVVFGYRAIDAFYIQNPCGKQCRLVIEKDSPISSRITRTLKPGAKFTETYDTEYICYNYSYDTRYTSFDFSDIGEYKITAGRKIPKLNGEGYVDVISNTVVLTVTAPCSPNVGS